MMADATGRKRMIKKAGNIFAAAYLILIFCLYPFYMEKGYSEMGIAKYHFFIYVSGAAFFILCLLAAACFFVKANEGRKQGKAYLIEWEKVSSTDLFVLSYATAVFLSYVFTDYRQEALWGTRHWYIGSVTLLLLCGFYFLISRLWDGKKTALILCMAASAVVFILGICNRFSFYPIAISGAQPGFISTLGNINWFCGYLAVVAPVGICPLLFGREKWKKRVYIVYSVIAFMAGFCQGSTSVFLWFFALFFLLFWIGLEKVKWLKEFFLTVFLWGVSGQAVRLLRYLYPGRYNYDLDNLCGYLTENSFILWIGAAALFFYVILGIRQENIQKKWDESKRFPGKKQMRKLLLIVTGAVGGLWIILSILNTAWGLPLLKENGFFIWNHNWGNGRGAAFHAGAQIFREMPLLHKLFGAGPDCFGKYAYSIPEIATMLRENFGGDRLTNAHNELLTGLVNTGIFGVLLYIGIFISFICRSLRLGKSHPETYVFAVCAFCYLVHNNLSFAHVLNLPFVFLFIGMGEWILRHSAASSENCRNEPKADR